MPNDFSQDSSCKAVWNFESPGYGNDSQNSNDLTDPNNQVLTDSQYHRQGSTSGAFQYSDSYLFIADNALSTGFPGKSGDTVRQGTYCFWLYLKSAPLAAATIFAKDHHVALQLTANSKLKYFYRYMANGSDWDWDSAEFGPALQTGRWYHVSLLIEGKEAGTVNNSKGMTAIYCVIYDSVADTTMGYTPGMWGGCVHAIVTSGTSNFTLGAWPDDTMPFLVGNLDEFVVFNRCLSFLEMMAIRKGNFPINNNDFSGSSLVGNWKFDSENDRLADSTANGNDFAGTPGADSFPSISAVGGNSCWMWGPGASHGRKDGDLSTGFPFKSNDTTKKGTFCLWYYTWPWFGSSPVEGVIIGKNDYGYAQGSFDLAILTNGKLKIEWNSSGTLETFNINYTLVDGVWYHFGLSIDGISKHGSLTIYDSSIDETTTFTISPSDVIGLSSYPDFAIGASLDAQNSIRCFVDDILVFNDALTTNDIENISANNYSAYKEIDPEGIGSVEGFGNTIVGNYVFPEGIVSGENFGNVKLGCYPSSIVTEEALGGATLDIFNNFVVAGAMNILGTSVFDVEGLTNVEEWAGSTGFVLSGDSGIDSVVPLRIAEWTTESVLPAGFVLSSDSDFDSISPPQTALDADGQIEISGHSKFSSVKPTQTSFLVDGGILITGPSVFEAVSPTSLETAFGAEGGLVWSSRCSIGDGSTENLVDFIAKGGFSFSGESKIVSPVMTMTILAASGGFDIEAFCSFDSPKAQVLSLAGSLSFLLGGMPSSVLINPLVTALEAAGGYLLGSLDEVEKVYEAWVLNGQSFEPSIFSAFNFNSFAQRGAQTFAAGEDGIYLLGGDNDDGEVFHTGARIGPVNFGYDRDKRLRGIQMGSCGPDTKVKVMDNDGGEGVFTPDIDENRVVVSRDIQGREFVIEIQDFQELSHFEAMILNLARR